MSNADLVAFSIREKLAKPHEVNFDIFWEKQRCLPLAEREGTLRASRWPKVRGAIS